jgi:hypothetical protein
VAGRFYALCAAAVIVALLVVGAVSDGVVRHLIQTSPLWIVVVLGLQGSAHTKWIALPMFMAWLAIMVLIWLFLLRLARILTGSYSMIEIAMTMVVGATSILVAVAFWRTRTGVSVHGALVALVIGAVVQVGAVALSIQAPLSSDSALSAWLKSAR